MLVSEHAATFLNAVKVWVLGIVLGLGVGLCAGVGLYFVGPSHDAFRMGLIVWGSEGLLALLIFLIRMKVYVTGFLRAFAMVFLTAILQVIVMVGLELTVLKGATSKTPLAWMQGLTRHAPDEDDPSAKLLADREASNEIDRLLTAALHPAGPPPTLQEHESMVEILQQKLQSRRDALPPDNPHEAALFQNQLNRYLYFLNVVKAERRTHPATPAPTMRVASATPSAGMH
jgi:hypothetical protein